MGRSFFYFMVPVVLPIASPFVISNLNNQKQHVLFKLAQSRYGSEGKSKCPVWEISHGKLTSLNYNYRFKSFCPWGIDFILSGRIDQTGIFPSGFISGSRTYRSSEGEK